MTHRSPPAPRRARRLAGLLLIAAAIQPGRALAAGCPADTHLVDIAADGAVVAGSIAALAAAVDRGAALRVGWAVDWNEDGRSDIRHWADAAFVSEFEGRYFAQVSAIESQIPVPGEARIRFADQSRRWSGLLGSDGKLTGRYDDGVPHTMAASGSWCLATPPAACEERWRLAYQHDTAGKPLAGSKERLFDAVRGGRPLRLAWGVRSSADASRYVEHVAEPVFVTVTDGEAYAQLPEHIAQKSYVGADAGRFESAAIMWRGLLGTSGSFDAVWVDRAAGTEVRRLPQRARVAWFAYGPDATCSAGQPLELAVPGGVIRDTG